MRKTLFIAFACCLLGLSGYSQGNYNYYYAFNKKVYLKSSKTKMLVSFKTPKQSFEINQMTDRGQLSYKLKATDYTQRTYMVDLKDQTAMEVFKDNAGENLLSAHPVYLTKSGLEMGVTNEIMVHFKKSTSLSQILALQKLFGVKVKKTAINYVLLEVPATTDAFRVANAYQETGLVEYAHPNFVMTLQKTAYTPNDPYFNKQFYLHNTGQTINDGRSGTADADVDAPEAWDITKGSSDIVVAVIDEGITSDHPDLPNSRQVRLKGSNFAASVDNSNTDDPSPTGDTNHGNACAGIVAATQDNNEGVTGIAPHVKIMPIRISYQGSNSLIVDAVNFAWQNGADIISNSWSYNDPNPNLVPALVTAFRDATTKGRGGKGAVVLIAAGNTADHDKNNSGFVGFPSNIDVSGVITVGASNRFDRQSDYSPTSDPSSANNQIIDLVAPSHHDYFEGDPNSNIVGLEIWTIDIPGKPGDNPGMFGRFYGIIPGSGTNHLAYTGRMGGTSAATPLVAGVAALVLSIDSSLTQQQVFDILTKSADDVGGYQYTNGISKEMGHGRVNAFEAVKVAKGISSSCGKPAEGTTTEITTSSAKISWGTVSGATEYTLRYRDENNTHWTTVNTTKANYLATGLFANSTYEVQVKATCATGTSNYVSLVNFTTNSLSSITYCSGYGRIWLSYIKNVTLGTINHTSGSDGGYKDFTSRFTNLTVGSSVNISITEGFNTARAYGYNYLVWIDFNQDGDFTDEGEQVFYQKTARGISSASGSISVPVGAKLGFTRMRVAMVDYGDQTLASCGDIGRGEVEDYSVKITNASTSSNEATVQPANSRLSDKLVNFELYPNPTTDEVQVRLNMAEETDVMITLTDNQGKSVMRKTVGMVKGGIIEKLNIGSLQKGVYLMTIQAKNGYKQTRKLIVK